MRLSEEGVRSRLVVDDEGGGCSGEGESFRPSRPLYGPSFWNKNESPSRAMNGMVVFSSGNGVFEVGQFTISLRLSDGEILLQRVLQSSQIRFNLNRQHKSDWRQSQNPETNL